MKSPVQKQVGNHIREARLTKGWGQGRLAKQLDISVAALSKIENGLTDLNLSRLIQIADIFEVSVLELISKDIDAAPTDLLVQLQKLQNENAAKDAEISKLQKKVIDLYEKLGL